MIKLPRSFETVSLSAETPQMVYHNTLDFSVSRWSHCRVWFGFFFIDNKETCPLKPSHFFLGAPQVVRFRRRRRRRNRRRRNRRSRRSRRRNGCATWNLASPRSRRRTRAPSAWNAGATWPSCAATAPATRARRRCAPATCAASLSPKRSTSTD